MTVPPKGLWDGGPPLPPEEVIWGPLVGAQRPSPDWGQHVASPSFVHSPTGQIKARAACAGPHLSLSECVEKRMNKKC